MGAAVVGGPIGVSLNNGLANAGITALSGGNSNESFKAFGVGLLTGYWGAKGGFGLAGKGMGGRLATQIINTSARSIGMNWAHGKGLFSRIDVGVGPLTLTLGEKQKLIQWGPNAIAALPYAFGFANRAIANLLKEVGIGDGASLDFDLPSLSVRFKGGIIAKIGGRTATGAYTIFNDFGTAENINHEGFHVWQTRFFQQLYLPTYILSDLYPLANGKDPLIYNFFEYQNFELGRPSVGWHY